MSLLRFFVALLLVEVQTNALQAPGLPVMEPIEIQNASSKATAGMRSPGHVHRMHKRPFNARSFSLESVDFRVAWEKVCRIVVFEDRQVSSKFETVLERLNGLLVSAPGFELFFFVVTSLLLGNLDLFVFQDLPETERTHVWLLIFWFLAAVAFNIEVWVQVGPQASVDWAVGFVIEVLFSIPEIFIFVFVVVTLETPRRLMGKTMFAVLVGAIAFRVLCLLGLAHRLHQVWISCVVGLGMAYCGFCLVRSEAPDVTQTLAVRASKFCLGDRLGEFYDEECEAVFVSSGKKVCVTLLGLVIACLVATDFVFAPNVTLAKLGTISSEYICLSSSTMALFTVRGLFFVLKDLVAKFGLMKYGVGAVLLSLGSYLLLAQARLGSLRAVETLFLVVVAVVVSVASSLVRDTYKNLNRRW